MTSLTVTVRDDYTPTVGDCSENTFILACLYVKSDLNYVILVPEKSIHGLKNVISGKFPVHFRWNFHRKKFLEKFALEFQGESLELFLSYRAHFRRYQHFRRFWQSTTSSHRDC
jgi:hypothetical protein